MEFRSDYERLAHYEAKMKYYGAKIGMEELDGGAKTRLDYLNVVYKIVNMMPANPVAREVSEILRLLKIQ